MVSVLDCGFFLFPSSLTAQKEMNKLKKLFPPLSSGPSFLYIFLFHIKTVQVSMGNGFHDEDGHRCPQDANAPPPFTSQTERREIKKGGGLNLGPSRFPPRGEVRGDPTRSADKVNQLVTGEIDQVLADGFNNGPQLGVQLLAAHPHPHPSQSVSL